MESTSVTFRAALLNILDVTIEVIFADASLDQRTSAERQALCTALQESLNPSAAGADVALVWKDAEGRMEFIAPPRQERFFQAMRYDQLYAQADRTVTVTLA